MTIASSLYILFQTREEHEMRESRCIKGLGKVRPVKGKEIRCQTEDLP
jgi:hypothetical protein